MPNRVVHFEVQADDLDRAKSFYEKAFGWRINKVMSKDKGQPMDYWMIENGEKGEVGINGGLYQRPEKNHYNSYECTIGVDDIDVAIKAVTDNGGQITQPKDHLATVGWLCGCVDTEGNHFGLIQPEPME